MGVVTQSTDLPNQDVMAFLDLPSVVNDLPRALAMITDI